MPANRKNKIINHHTRSNKPKNIKPKYDLFKMTYQKDPRVGLQYLGLVFVIKEVVGIFCS